MQLNAVFLLSKETIILLSILFPGYGLLEGLIVPSAEAWAFLEKKLKFKNICPNHYDPLLFRN